MPNPQIGKIILVDRTEVDADGRGSFLRVYDMAGVTHRIAEKRHALWPIFQNARKAEPILTLYETYNNVEYIANARPITDEILKSAVQILGERVTGIQVQQRNRSTALSYSKDLVVADKLSLEDLYKKAEDNYKFIVGKAIEENADKKGQ